MLIKKNDPKSQAFIDGKYINTRLVDSSNVVWVGWPQEGEPLMLVRFKNDTIYGYLGVSRQRAVACAYAKSTGSYINKLIKPHYEAVKLAEPIAA